MYMAHNYIVVLHTLVSLSSVGLAGSVVSRACVAPQHLPALQFVRGWFGGLNRYHTRVTSR